MQVRLDIQPLGGHLSGPTLTLVHGNPVLNTVYWTEDRSDAFCLKMAGRLGAGAGDVVAVELVRVGYDLARAAAAIRESELPDEFASFLETGGKG